MQEKANGGVVSEVDKGDFPEQTSQWFIGSSKKATTESHCDLYLDRYEKVEGKNQDRMLWDEI